MKNLKKALILLFTAVSLIATTVPASAATVKEVPATKISFPTSATIIAGNKTTLTVKATPNNTTYKTLISWSYKGNKTVYTAKANGTGTKNSKASSVTLTGKAAGNGTVTATVKLYTSKGKLVKTQKLSCKVTVKKSVALKSIAMSAKTASLNEGKSTTLKVTYNPTNTTVSKNVTWTTSNKNVATVSNGKITAKKAGTATITAKVGGKSTTCKVTVKSVQGTKAIPTVDAGNGKFVDVTECYNTLTTFRKNVSKKAYTKDGMLEYYAKIRAKELVTNYSHTRPNGTKGLSIIPGNLFKGENIAMGYRSCASVMTGWYNSAGHRANMLDSDFTKVGIAAYELDGITYWVQLFSS